MERVTKIFYLFLIVVFVVPAILFFFLINNWQAFFDYFNGFISCPASSGAGFECIGASGVYRLSFSLLCLFFMMMVLMLCRNRCAMIMNEGLFCFKYIFVVALFIGLLWISNDVFTGYATASQYISIVFMVLQSIILIDLFYLAGIRLVKRYDEGETHCAGVLVVFTVIIESGAIAMNVLGYIYSTSIFNQASVCGSTLWVNIVTSIILAVLPILQIFNFNKQNSLLTTALVSLYVSYLAFIAQFSYVPDVAAPECNRVNVSSLVSDVVVSTLFFVVTMYGTIMGGTGQVKVTRDGDLNKAVGVAPTENNQDDEEEKKDTEIRKNINEEQEELSNEEKYHSCKWVLFHFHMCLASIYVGMLITNWTSASIVTGQLQSNGFGFWVRVAMAWVTTLLYIWTLIIPRICPTRDFTVE